MAAMSRTWPILRMRPSAMTRIPTYHFRMIRKGIGWADAQRKCIKLLENNPDKDYRVIKLDGADGRYNYRIILLRDHSDDLMYDQDPFDHND